MSYDKEELMEILKQKNYALFCLISLDMKKTDLFAIFFNNLHF